MEKDTITIVIRQEVSVTLVWIATGVVLVCAAFLLAPDSMELWPALNWGGVAGAVYLVALLLFTLRKPIGRKPQILIGTIAAVTLILGTFTWVRFQEQVEWQAGMLMKIRGTIGRGVMRMDMSSIALKTLDEFHRRRAATKKTLRDVFLDQYPNTAVGMNVNKPEWEGDQRQAIISRLEPDVVELVAQETYVPGRDSSFKNYNGQRGMIQERFILTEKGVSHVSEN